MYLFVFRISFFVKHVVYVAAAGYPGAFRWYGMAALVHIF
jgi:hypothetical protein